MASCAGCHDRDLVLPGTESEHRADEVVSQATEEPRGTTTHARSPAAASPWSFVYPYADNGSGPSDWMYGRLHCRTRSRSAADERCPSDAASPVPLTFTAAVPVDRLAPSTSVRPQRATPVGASGRELGARPQSAGQRDEPPARTCRRARAEPRRRPVGRRVEIPLRQGRRRRAPEVATRGSFHAIVPVRVGWVVLLGHVITEEEIGERLEAVRVVAGDVDGDRILVADVLGERLAALAIEHDHASHPLQAGEEVVLPALVEVQPANHTLTGERDVRLPPRFRKPRRPGELDEPAALVLEPPERDHLHAPFMRACSPRSSTNAPSLESASCVPASATSPARAGRRGGPARRRRG